MPYFSSAFLGLLLCALASSSPTPLPKPNVVEEPAPDITPFRVSYEPTKTRLQPRANIISDIEQGLTSVLSKLGSDIPSYVASGRFSTSSSRFRAHPNFSRCSPILPGFSYWVSYPVFLRYWFNPIGCATYASIESSTLCKLDQSRLECSVSRKCLSNYTERLHVAHN